MGNEQAKSEVATGFGIQSMDQHLQRKFSKGIQFNMKIVIKGDRNSGKTSLFHRLQGKPFQESYIPTDEIQVSSILWSYKETQDTVKVEVWDVVDKGKSQKKKKQGKLKMFNDPEVQDPTSQPLDAQFLDVYKGTHGVIFVFDMTKQWTYQYVTRELPLVPYHIPVIVLANFRDMGEHRVISNLEAINFVELLERPEGSADVRYAECSMKDGFGLKYLHKFFSIPFLHLQQESLLQQLQVNRELLVSTVDELAIDENSEEQNYELFKEAVAQRMKQKEKRIAEEKAAAAAAAMANTGEQSTDDKGKEVTKSPSAPVVQQPSPSESAKRNSFRAKLSQKFSNKKLSPVTAKKEPTKETPSKVTKASGKNAVANIDDFVPDEEIDTNFLTEEGDEEHNKLFKKESDESDDDVIDNPLVAGDEDIDSEEDEPAPSKPVTMVADTKSITDDDDDDDEVDSTDKKNEQKIPITSADEQKGSPELAKQQKASPKPAEHQKTSPKPVKPVTTRPALISAKSVELTESSSEDDDDDEAEQLVQAKKKQPIKPVKETVAPAPKFSGLKLEHSLPASTPPKKEEPSEEESSRVKEKESRTSLTKEKKSRTKKKKPREEVDDKDDVKQSTSVMAAVTTDTAGVNDPFSSSLLDAWLDSPTGDPLAPILQPTSMRKTEKGSGDQTTDATEEKKKHRHKKHKHKHKHSETSASGEKKRHKHREPSTTTESSEPAGNDYVALL